MGLKAERTEEHDKDTQEGGAKVHAGQLLVGGEILAQSLLISWTTGTFGSS
jgi:hypothetical protein